mgnify:CR=1 FL=1
MFKAMQDTLQPWMAQTMAQLSLSNPFQPVVIANSWLFISFLGLQL